MHLRYPKCFHRCLRWIRDFTQSKSISCGLLSLKRSEESGREERSRHTRLKKTLKQFNVCEHLTSDRFLSTMEVCLNNEENNSHDPTLLCDFIKLCFMFWSFWIRLQVLVWLKGVPLTEELTIIIWCFFKKSLHEIYSFLKTVRRADVP